MQIWSTEDRGQPVRQAKLEAAETPTAACYSRDGACLALGTASGAMLILDSFRLAVLAVLRDAHLKRVSLLERLTVLSGACRPLSSPFMGSVPDTRFCTCVWRQTDIMPGSCQAWRQHMSESS